MKKIFLIIGVFFLLIGKLNAACDYSRLVELNTYASHIDYSYNYNDSTKLFDVTLTNVVDSLNVSYDNKYISKNDSKVVISNIEEGKYIKIKVTSNDSLCVNEDLRVIAVTMPYLNLYYNSEECTDYMKLTVCNSRFLNYKLTYSNFKSILEKYDNANNNGEENEGEEEEPVANTDETIIDIVYSVIEKYWMEASLVAGSSLITILIGNLIYKRVKYKL